MKKTISIIAWILLAVGSGVLFNIFEFNPVPVETGIALPVPDHGDGNADEKHSCAGEGPASTPGKQILPSCEGEKDPHDHGHKAAPVAGEKADADHQEHGEFCAEHRIPEAEDALCQPDAISRLQPGQGLKVRLAAPDAGEKAGIAVSRPAEASQSAGAVFPGRTEFDRARFARITPPAPGTVRRVLAALGAPVAKGTLLAEIAAPELSALKASLLAAMARQSQTEAAWQREKDLLARGITSRQEYQAAEAEYQAARSATDQYRRQLEDFGLSSATIAELLRTGANHSVLPVKAPFAGILSETHISVGEFVETGAHLFTVADLDSLWIAVSVSEAQIHLVKMGIPVEAEFDGLPGRAFTGRIFQIGAALDEQSRTLKVLAEVENPDHALKAGMFGRVRFISENRAATLAVPSDAVQDIDGNPYLFVRLEADLFELRRIEKGNAVDGMIPIASGLSPAEEIVSAQAFALKSEVLKARLGASCADH